MERARQPDVGKATSEIVHPTQPQAEHREQPRQIDHNFKVIHARHSEIQQKSSSSKTSVDSNTTELSQHLEKIRKSWKKPESNVHLAPPTRSHLKQEPFQFHEYLHYNVEFPNRVVLQILRLLGTTRVHLNDLEFVLKLQNLLGQEDDLRVTSNEQRRIKMEYNRLRKLLFAGTIDGSMLPPELQSLTAHPAYRATQMMKRIDDNEKNFHLAEEPKTKIIPVEPFEFNSNKYFKHLHKMGNTNWVPKQVRKKRQMLPKVKDPEVGKAPKKKRLRTLFKGKNSVSDSNTNLPMGLSVSNLASSEYGSSSASASRDDKYELPDKNKLKLFLEEETAADSRELQHREQKRMLREIKTEKLNLGQQTELMIKSSESSRVPRTVRMPTSLEQLLKTCGVSDQIDSYQNKRPEVERILTRIDETQDVDELFGNAEALNKLYAREAQFAEKFPFQRFNERFQVPYEYSVPGRK